MSSGADHESRRSLAEPSERRPRGIEHSFALHRDGGLELLGSANGISNNGFGNLMYQTTFGDESCRRGHFVIRTHHKERRVFIGRLPGSELDGGVAHADPSTPTTMRRSAAF